MISNPVPWPNGARVACAITFDIDTDSILHLEHREKAPTTSERRIHRNKISIALSFYSWSWEYTNMSGVIRTRQ